MAARMKRRVGADNVAVVEPSEVSAPLWSMRVRGRVWMAVRRCAVKFPGECFSWARKGWKMRKGSRSKRERGDISRLFF